MAKRGSRESGAASITAERAAALLAEWHGLKVAPASAEIAAADFSRVNRMAGGAADAQHDFWQSPSDLRTLLEGDA